MSATKSLSDVFAQVVGSRAPVGFRAYDGSSTESEGSPPKVTIVVREPDAVRHVASAPGELGLARAYVSGTLDIEGDMYTALRTLGSQVGDMTLSERIGVVRDLGPGMVLRRPQIPTQESRQHGRRHSKTRDAEVISHHYDVSNRFYEWVLGPSMAYTCAVFPTEDATLEEAQEEKHDLVCRKLALQPGMRLLDVGCGWGGMVMHAAKHYGVTALGVTLSKKQATWAADAIDRAGLGKVAEVRHGDYRDITESGFDAISSIGLTEHVGLRQLPAYFQLLRSKVRPEGRLLNHQITRPTNKERARAGKFINRYVFPDGELLGVGTIISAMQDNGWEVRHEENLREHYARTLAGWSANLEEHWDEAVEEVGPGTARVWRLYMAASRMGFTERNIELHQVLGVRVTDEGESGMELRPDFTRNASRMTR